MLGHECVQNVYDLHLVSSARRNPKTSMTLRKRAQRSCQIAPISGLQTMRKTLKIFLPASGKSFHATCWQAGLAALPMVRLRQKNHSPAGTGRPLRFSSCTQWRPNAVGQPLGGEFLGDVEPAIEDSYVSESSDAGSRDDGAPDAHAQEAGGGERRGLFEAGRRFAARARGDEAVLLGRCPRRRVI